MVKHASRARPMWSGTISFGLVSIPVTLWPAVREGRVSMRMLTPEGHPLGRRYFSDKGREIHPEHLIRGYKVDEDRYVAVTEEELESLAPEKSRDIDLRRFVKAQEVDPIYFERAYVLLPSEGSNKAYRLLAETMERTGRVGIATFVMRDKEYLVAILAGGGILRAVTMRFADEIRSPEDVGLPEPREARKADVSRFEKAIAQHTARRFDSDDMEDRGKDRLLKLVHTKQKKRQDIVESPEAAGEEDEGGPSMTNLMAALEESMTAAKARRKK